MTRRRSPPLATLRAFEAAGRLRSFKQAAGELAVTATAISHQIRSLELWLGCKLFERRARRVELTAAGRELLPVLRDGFDALAAAIDRVQRADRGPAVTVSTTPAFAAKWLLPRLPRLQAQHPGIDLRISATDEVVDLASGAADIAIRYGRRGRFPGLDAVLLLADRFAAVASPNLKLREKRDLAGTRLIDFDWRRADPANPSWQMWLRRARLNHLDAAKMLRFNDESLAIQAAVAGQGCALLSLALVARELEQGILETPFGLSLRAPSYYVVWSKSRVLTRAAEAVKRWLLVEARKSAVPADIA